MSLGGNIQDKSFAFAVEVIKFREEVINERHYEIASQFVRSGTGIGANIREAQRAESRKDFRHKLQIALKEADETKYWLELIEQTIRPVPKALFDQNEELIKILVTIIKNTEI
ncbi:MAG: four helix bundle protein [Crocinitomicaceae bacterium]|nr:four helix bundle protein [Crocinitomicaceae bacterium]